MKRFLNADSYASTGQGFLGYNMFAYCGNCPTVSSDADGNMADIAIEQGIDLLTRIYEWLASGGAEAIATTLGSILIIEVCYDEIKDQIKERVETSKPPELTFDQSVYIMRNAETLRVEYVGRTNDPARRQAEHSLDPSKSGLLPLQVVKTGLTKDEARVYEQSLIMAYGLEYLRNRRREIATKKATAFDQIASYIGQLEYGFFQDELREMLR